MSGQQRRTRGAGATVTAAAVTTPGAPGYLRTHVDGCLVRVHVQPRAKLPGFAGLHGDRLKLRVAEPPAEGAANGACIAAVALRLGVPRTAVRLARGARSRDKDFVVAGLSLAQVQAIFEGSEE